MPLSEVFPRSGLFQSGAINFQSGRTILLSPFLRGRDELRSRQPRATLPRYLPGIEDHEKDLVGASRETVGRGSLTVLIRPRIIVNRRG